MEDQDTKTRILDAAETLFAENGFSAVSLRSVIKEAGVNTASVHYHFGSKDGLVAAVIERRATPVNAERLEMLDEIEARHPTGSLPLKPVLEAFVFPVVRLRRGGKEGRPMFARLLARLLHEPDPKAARIVHETFAEIFSRFSGAFARTLPSLSPQEIHMRLHFAVGAMAFSIAGPHFFERFAPTKEIADDRHVMASLVNFIEAGLETPVAAAAHGEGT
jgi:AcrR family transcriptional regulator